MSFSNISRLSNSTQVDSSYYFADANVWIYALQRDESLNCYQKAYSDFFYRIIDSESEIKPKFLLPTLLFSEIINIYLKKFALIEYANIEGISKPESIIYKKDYRPTQHYKDSYEKICDDINALRESILFIDDSSIVGDSPFFMTTIPNYFDFNDYFYYQLCKTFSINHPLIIITNDGDFRINDMPIYTVSKELLNLR